MESLVIHPDNEAQLKAVKSFLKELNVRFEKQQELPDHIILSVKKGIDEYKKGNHISLDQFKERHFLNNDA